jgi:TolB-like protein
MGEVYRARDARLDRDVAIKVLPADLAGDVDALARFEQEAKAVAALSHPHILSIFDFGTHEGIAYAVTELLEGRTLRNALDEGALPEPVALDYARQIAKGLVAAHAKGVIHRDMKPENLFITEDGHLKILDFGLAKRQAGRDGGSAADLTQLTQVGAVMGTLGYMPPEQLRGQTVDQRADIFAFGAVLYEMLSGRRAFTGPTPADTLSAVLNLNPPEFAASGHAVTPAFDSLVRRCLEKDVARRLQSARELAAGLESITPGTSIGSTPGVPPAIGDRPSVMSGAPGSGVVAAAPAAGSRRALIYGSIAGVLLIAAIAAGITMWRAPATTPAGPPRVAVLPFENLGTPDEEYFADGITDEVRGKLTSIDGLQVIARGSSIPYKKTTKTPREIGRELDVQYLLTATVRWQKSPTVNRVQVSPELVDVSGDGAAASKWQQPFDAEPSDVFQVQADIATRVAQALGVALGLNEEQRLAVKPTENLAAYDAFLRGEELSKAMGAADPASLRQALAQYDKAVALDPSFTHAWARVSLASTALYTNSTPVPAMAERAREAADRALALAPDGPEGYFARGEYLRGAKGDPAGALQQTLAGLTRVAGHAGLLSSTAAAEIILGRWEAAVDHLRQGERIDPRSVQTKRRLSNALLRLRRYPEAREVLDRGIALAPTDLSLIELKAMTFIADANLAGARAVMAAVPAAVEPTTLVSYFAFFQDLGWVLDDAQRDLLLRLTPTALDDDKGAWGIVMAQAYALRGDAAKVREHAEVARQAFEEQLKAEPNDAQRRMQLGWALAFLGQKADAIREGERGAALLPVAKDAYLGPYLQHELGRIYIQVGEHDKGLDLIEPLLKIPYFLSPGWLKIDPAFEPLRSNARFQKLIGSAG